MKSKPLLFAVFLGAISSSLNGQVITRGPSQLFSSLGFIEIVGPDDPTIKGDVHLFEQRKKGDLDFKVSKSMEDVWINYDIYNSKIILFFKGKRFSIDFSLVDSVTITDTNKKLINSRYLKGVPPNTPLMVLYDSPNLIFFEKPDLKIIKPSYNRELDIGTRDTKIVHEFQYMIFEKDSQNHFFFKQTKNGIKSLEHYKELKEHVKANNYKLDNADDAVKLVKFYEALKFK